jgi:hypothetical protein
MSIPTRKDLRLPVLRQFAAGGEHSSEDVRAAIEFSLQMSRSERQKRMKNGVRLFVNRVAWALVDLQREGALVKLRTQAGRGELTRTCVYEITASGRQMLQELGRIIVHPNQGCYSPSQPHRSRARCTETHADMSFWCVYAIKATKHVTNAAATGTGTFTEYKRWTSAANLLALLSKWRTEGEAICLPVMTRSRVSRLARQKGENPCHLCGRRADARLSGVGDSPGC